MKQAWPSTIAETAGNLHNSRGRKVDFQSSPANEFETGRIKTAVERHFSPKGGDIDLLVKTNITGSELQEARLLAMGTIQRAIGEQKIDIVMIETGCDFLCTLEKPVILAII